MAHRTLDVNRPLDEVWAAFQLLATWEGMGGMRELHDGQWNETGDLIGFRYQIDTPIGLIRDRADVRPIHPRLAAATDAKGIAISVDLVLVEFDASTTTIDFTIEGRSTSFLTRPLVGALQSTLESGIDRERATLATRLQP